MPPYLNPAPYPRYLSPHPTPTLTPTLTPIPQEFTRAVTAGERVELRTPVREAGYLQHAGAVFGLDCSPFQVGREKEGLEKTEQEVNRRKKERKRAV